MNSFHVACSQNEPLALYILQKREELVAKKEGYREKLDATLTKAYRNVCDSKNPICNLREASQVNGIGQWMLKLLKDFFSDESAEGAEVHDQQKEEKVKQRRYVPQKSSAPYAILLTLHKAMQEGREYMKKQELIDAADASGLSRMPIQTNKSSGMSGQFGSSTKDWYSGWSSMKTLVSKGLVVRSSCPAKYKLSEEGMSTAEECIQRSGLNMEFVAKSFSGERLKKCSASVSSATADINLKASHPISSSCSNPPNVNVHANKNISHFNRSLHTEVVADLSSDSEDEVKVDSFTCHEEQHLQTEVFRKTSNIDVVDNESNLGGLRMPPLLEGEQFVDVYAVILILDDREQFMNGSKGNARDKFADQLQCQFKIEVEVRHLPIGDTLWIARHKVSSEEYVLDFILERKKVGDLLSSIKDTRYKQQKLRLLRSGLRKLIYVVEGDPNVMDSAESIKTACFTTEIAEGFDVQRTSNVRDTMRLYGHLTHAIYGLCDELSRGKHRQSLCKTYRQFVDDCKALEKERVRDVFGVMLMQVKQVTESIAQSILDRYPTPLSLMSAYSKLKGDEKAQENLLKGIPIRNQNKEITGVVSKKVFQFICSNECNVV